MFHAVDLQAAVLRAEPDTHFVAQPMQVGRGRQRVPGPALVLTPDFSHSNLRQIQQAPLLG